MNEQTSDRERRLALTRLLFEHYMVLPKDVLYDSLRDEKLLEQIAATPPIRRLHRQIEVGALKLSAAVVDVRREMDAEEGGEA